MISFRERAFCLLAWKAWLATLVAVVLMVTRGVPLATALLIGANVALLFSVGLWIYACWLTEERVPRTEAWRRSAPGERPALGRARTYLEELSFRFAKGAAAVAIALSGSALVLSVE